MPRVYISRLAAVVVCLWLLGAVLAGGAWPQTTAGPTAGLPATLRLAQVVPRLPAIHFFAVAENEAGSPVQMSPSDLSALIGSGRLKVDFLNQPDADAIAIVFLIDISASLGPVQVGMIKRSVQNWIGGLHDSDRAAIVTLGTSVKTVVDFTNNKTALNDAVAGLVFRDQQTLLYQGLVRAIDVSKRLDKSLPLRRAIVVLTDGMDDQQGGAGRQDVLSKLEIDPTPIYGIGASTEKNRKVDEALKDFGAIVHASGGEFRRVEVTTLDRGYGELRNLVMSTRHLIARCDGCLPDGSTMVTRLFMTQGTASFSSDAVTVRAVGPAGEVVPHRPVEPSVPWWKNMLDAIMRLGWQWLVLAVLALAAVIAGLIAIFIPKQKPSFETTRIIREPGATMPVVNPDSTFGISPAVSIAPGTEQHKQRLRLTPLGTNDLPAEEAIFEGDLSVGRSQDNKVYIYNDTQVSSKHCTLSPKDGRILVTDEGSRNGTRVNGVPIEGFIHAEPDSILGVGRTEMRMQLLASGQQ
jgi:Mg-chelatase subunit ChlD